MSTLAKVRAPVWDKDAVQALSIFPTSSFDSLSFSYPNSCSLYITFESYKFGHYYSEIYHICFKCASERELGQPISSAAPIIACDV